VSARAWFYGPEGFGSTRGSFPSSETVRKTDESMRLTDAGRCPFCKSKVPFGEQCPCWNKEEA
jgi:hypothetical protein